MTPRIHRLRERALRSYWITPEPLEPPAAEAGDGPLVRQAKTYADWCRRVPIVLSDDELIAGTPAHIAYGEELTTPYAFGRQPFKPWPFLEGDPATAAYFRAGLLNFAGNHTTVDYAAILAVGFTGLIARVDARLAKETTPEQADFLHALRIVAAGYGDYCRRYGDLAETQVATAAPERVAELRVIADTCRRVVAEPPRTFREACQALWFAFLFMPDAPGRVDALLAPFYARDLADGTLTREDARELLSALWIRYFEFTSAGQAVSALHHLTLGGVNPDGSDASSDLTDLCLEVTADLGLHRPQVGLRWHREMPIERLRNAVRTWRSRAGGPDLCNDEQLVPALTNLGIVPEDARDYSLSGCQEVIISGKAQMGSVEGFMNLPKTLRVALGLEPDFLPPRPLASFDDLWAAWEEALTLVIDRAHAASLVRDRETARDPWLNTSLVVSDCIEQARGYTQGGARYNFCNWNIIGAANAVDGLLAVKTLVFDTSAATLEELRAALAADWEGFASLRQRVARVPRFGNDDATVDALAARMVERIDALFKRHTPYRGGVYILGTTAGGENMHVEFGRMTGATPDGRRAGETFADSIGAAHGRDTHGVTALLNSVARLPHRLLPTATTLNVKLDPRTLETEEGIANVAELIRAHFLTGGQHIQVNLVDRATLLDARAHPERYRDLTVRVAGYSAQFVALWDDLQEEIIARTGHGLEGC
jgi:formate C-acetyltransferase